MIRHQPIITKKQSMAYAGRSGERVGATPLNPILFFYKIYKKYFIARIALATIICTWAPTTSCFSWSSLVSWLPFSSYQEVETQEFPCDTQPMITLTNQRGEIKITTWNQPKIVVQSTKQASSQALLAEIKETVEYKPEEKNLSLASSFPSEGTTSLDYNLVVPKESNLTVVAGQGSIKIKEPAGVIRATTEQGDVKITDPIGNTSVITDEGSVIVHLKEFPETASLFITIGTGTVNLKTLACLQAKLVAKAPEGSIKSDLPITLEPRTMLLSKESWKEAARDVQGSINGGTAPITIAVQKGDIHLEEE